MAAAIGKTTLIVWLISMVVLGDRYTLVVAIPRTGHQLAAYGALTFANGIVIAFLWAARFWEDIASDWRGR